MTEYPSHCCFAGCEPRTCGCCFYAIFHEPECSENPDNKLREAMDRIRSSRKDKE